MTRTRWLLHPLAAAVALLVVGSLSALRALSAPPGGAAVAGAMLLCVAVAGAAAGFAGSGSTGSRDAVLLLGLRRERPVLRYLGAGLLLGALLVASAGALLGALPRALVPAPVRWVLFGLVAVVVLACEVGPGSFRGPADRRLRPADPGRLRDRDALRFGFDMGVGLRACSTSTLPHLALLAVVLVVPFAAAFAMAAGLAAGRLAMPLLSEAWSDDDEWSLIWSRAERAVRPLLALVCVGAITAATLVV